MKTLDGLNRQGERTRWLLAAALALLSMGVTLAVSRLTFETNDDCSIITVAAGLLTGTPRPATVSTGYSYGALLAALYGLCATVPWHTVLLLACQYGALTALAMGALTLCAEAGFAAWVGVAVYASLYIGVLLPFTAQLQFSAVAGFAATGALLLPATLPKGAGHRARAARIAAAALLWLAAFGLRPNVALMLCPLWALWGLGALLRRVPRRRAQALLAAGALALTGALTLTDQALYAAEPGWAAFTAFDREATALLDYNTAPLPAEALHTAAQAAGWSDGLLGLVRNWYFLDARIQTDSLARLNSALAAAQAADGGLGAVLKATGSVARRYPMFGWNLLGWGLAALAACGVALRRRQGWLAAELLARLGYAILLIAYFYGVLGRFPLRLAVAVAAPTYALLWPGLAAAFAPGAEALPEASAQFRPLSANLIAKWSESRKAPTLRRAAALALAAALLGGTLTFALDPGHGLAPRWATAADQTNAALADAVNTYVAAHPDTVFVTDYCQNFAPTAIYAPGQLRNLLYWGSGISRSPVWQAQLAGLGMEQWNSQAYFNANTQVLLVGGEGPRSALEQYLKADYGLTALTEVEKTAAFTVYQAIR
ncbi:MAG: hypothetical protein VB104_05860 [Candidatus Limiplasma sp.]|nr:hypothetical protein [Candidatus Limiplasma sp.]